MRYLRLIARVYFVLFATVDAFIQIEATTSVLDPFPLMTRAGNGFVYLTIAIAVIAAATEMAMAMAILSRVLKRMQRIRIEAKIPATMPLAHGAEFVTFDQSNIDLWPIKECTRIS